MKPWIGLALCCLPAFAMAEGLRCSDKIIDKGRSRAEVAALCGKPVQVDNTTPYEGAAVAIEIWIYNFGPNQLMARIRFEDGIVANIETLGYGYNEP